MTQLEHELNEALQRIAELEEQLQAARSAAAEVLSHSAVQALYHRGNLAGVKPLIRACNLTWDDGKLRPPMPPVQEPDAVPSLAQVRALRDQLTASGSLPDGGAPEFKAFWEALTRVHKSLGVSFARCLTLNVHGKVRVYVE